MKHLPALLFLAIAAPASAQDRADMDRTQIIGNRELPKVLYIVPWKKPLHGTMGGRAVTSVIDEALAPIDREVLRREIRCDAQIRAAAQLANGAPATPQPATPAATPPTTVRAPPRERAAVSTSTPSQ